MTNPVSNSSHNDGFTLVELSIVLVIIGLIVGGVLVGQEMIKAAQVRATMTQIEKYNTAVNMFRNKYDYLPGDLRTPTNFFAATAAGTAQPVTAAGLANGNGFIEDANNAAAAAPMGYDLWGANGGEIIFFFAQLAQAGLIENNYTAPATYALGTSIPTTKLNNCHLVVFGDSTLGRNFYEIGGHATDATIASCLLPIDAYTIDQKLDDGNALTGMVVASGTNGNLNQNMGVLAGAGTCYAGATGIYTAAGAAAACRLRINMQ